MIDIDATDESGVQRKERLLFWSLYYFSALKIRFSHNWQYIDLYNICTHMSNKILHYKRFNRNYYPNLKVGILFRYWLLSYQSFKFVCTWMFWKYGCVFFEKNNINIKLFHRIGIVFLKLHYNIKTYVYIHNGRFETKYIKLLYYVSMNVK